MMVVALRFTEKWPFKGRTANTVFREPLYLYYTTESDHDLTLDLNVEGRTSVIASDNISNSVSFRRPRD